jgi:hypothetical protein
MASNMIAAAQRTFKMPLYQKAAIIVAIGGFLFGYVRFLFPFTPILHHLRLFILYLYFPSVNEK